MPAWIVAVAVILVLQTASAYLSRLVPIASPAFMAEFGWDESWIGYLTAANIVGALFVLFALIGLIQRMGSVLALQASLAIGAASLLLFHVPSLAVALLASALIGLAVPNAPKLCPPGPLNVTRYRRLPTATFVTLMPGPSTATNRSIGGNGDAGAAPPGFETPKSAFTPRRSPRPSSPTFATKVTVPWVRTLASCSARATRPNWCCSRRASARPGSTR